MRGLPADGDGPTSGIGMATDGVMWQKGLHVAGRTGKSLLGPLGHAAAAPPPELPGQAKDNGKTIRSAAEKWVTCDLEKQTQKSQGKIKAAKGHPNMHVKLDFRWNFFDSQSIWFSFSRYI